jgi:hypothetical protein
VYDCYLRASSNGIGAMVAFAYDHHRQPVAGRLRWLGPWRGRYDLGRGLWWLGWRLRCRLVECRLGRRLWRRLRWKLGWSLECRLEWLGWGCLHLDGLGLAVLTFSLTSKRK